MNHSPEEPVGAQISHNLALVLSTATEPHHNGELIPGHRLGLSNTHNRLISI